MTKPKPKSDVADSPLNYNLSEDQKKPDYNLEPKEIKHRLPSIPGKKIRNKELARIMKKQYPEYLLSEFQDFLRIFQIVVEEQVSQGNAVMIEDLGIFYPYRSSPRYRWLHNFDGKKEYKYCKGVTRLKFLTGTNAEIRISKTTPFGDECTETLPKRENNFIERKEEQ